MQFTGLWTFPQIQKALADDFGVLPWPKLNSTTGEPSVPVGAYSSAVSAKSKNVDAAKQFVQWLWVDQSDKQLDWAQSYGFHIPVRKSLAEKADKLKSGPAADAVKFVNENGRAQTPLLWTPQASTAYSDALNRIIKNGTDPATEIKAVKAVVEAELKRIAGWTQCRPRPRPRPRPRRGRRRRRRCRSRRDCAVLRDASFRSSLLAFVVFALFIVPTTFVASLGLALLVNRASCWSLPWAG